MEQSVDIGRPFAFVFEDPDWIKKVLLAALITLIPIAGILVLFGYQRRVALATAESRDVPLPEWDLLLEDLVEGLKIFAIRLVYLLPGILVFFALGFGMAVFGAAGGRDPDEVMPVFMLGAFCLGMPLIFLGVLVGAIAMLKFIHDADFGAAFHPGALVEFARENLTNLLLGLVTVILVGMAGQLVGLLLCLIGVLVTRPWAMIASGQVMGQIIRAHRARHHADSKAAAVFT